MGHANLMEVSQRESIDTRATPCICIKVMNDSRLIKHSREK